jgi:acyl-coenzyme A synthetase/AMP-(fatty) acid ligase
MADAPGVAPDDILLAVTTLSFDIALLDLFVPLLVGARVELAPVEEQLAPERLLARLTACGATIMQATPVTWRMLLGAGWGGRLRAVLCGGEAFPPELLVPLAARADAVWNLYGPTETTIWSTAARIEALPAKRRIPIGRPIANTRVYVMNPDGRPLPDGEPGELWIAGAGVARGYRDRPALQARQFVPDPMVPDARAYRTGDLGRVTDDGQLEHLGRIDEQMKLHGYRIEPAEVEAALTTVAGVQQAVVALAGPEDDPRLVGYVRYTTDASSRPTASAMRRQLRDTLPDYMVPAMLVEIEQVPLTPNGKVNRRALPDPFAASARPVSSPEDDAPRTPVERALASAWQVMLARDRVRRHDNFFELGGHSLLALRVVETMAREHGLTIDVRSLFYRTLAQVAEEAG